MGSTAVEKNKRQEEEKEKEKEPMFKSTGVRPTFTGRVKIGGGDTKQSTGSNTLYSMEMKYKPENAEGAKTGEEKNKFDGQTTEVRKDKRRINQDRKTFDQDKAFNDQDLEDEGFKMTVDRNVIRRQ